MGIIRGLSSIVVAVILATTPIDEEVVTKVDYGKNTESAVEVQKIEKKKIEKPVKKENWDVVSLPIIENSFKSFMDYRAITDVSSKQWKMQESASTDEDGLRKIDKYYCVAVGSGIAQLGSKLRVTLSDSKTFYAIVSDQKADIHTDDTNKYRPTSNGGNIVEFIVETESLPSIVIQMGDVSYVPNDKFYGEITKIEVMQ